MEFRKYQHIERFGTDEVDGMSLGSAHFIKLMVQMVLCG